MLPQVKSIQLLKLFCWYMFLLRFSTARCVYGLASMYIDWDFLGIDDLN